MFHDQTKHGARMPGLGIGGSLALIVTVAVLAVAACGNRVSSDKPQPSSTDQDMPGTNAGHADNSTPSKENASMSSIQQDIELIQSQYAEEFNVAKSDIKVRVADKVRVPGLTVFSAVVNPAKAGRNIHRSGIVDDGAIYTEGDAMARVAKAWSYGKKRTVTATEFARVMGQLHSGTHGTAALVDADTLDVFKSTAYPKQAAAAALPKELTVDGLPAVQYCITSEARSIPFSVVTATVHPDFRVELRVQPIMSE